MAKGKGKPAGGTLADSATHLLHRALQLALDFHADLAGPQGLTQRQFAVLSAAAAREGLTQSDLVRATGIDRSTLADLVARMIKKGLLARKKSESDARANAVSLTEAGRAALEDAQPKMAAVDARLLKLLSGGKRDALTGLLRDLVKGGDEAAAPEAVKPPKPPKPEKVKKAKADKKPKAEKPAKSPKPEKADKPKKAKKAA